MNDGNQSNKPSNNGVHLNQRWTPDVRTILLAETNSNVRSVMKEFLETRGYRVLDASTKTQAHAISHGYQGKIHLFITEVFFPGMNDGTLLKRIMQQRPGIRILLVSSGSVPDFEAKLIGRLKIPVIWKPFSFLDLEGTVDELIRKHTQF